MDSLTPIQRSLNMARIRSRDTKPEVIVRKLAHRLGFRFRLYRRDLPGTPDLTFPALRKVIFVNGCFWHRHPGCRFAYEPKSNVEFWRRKFMATRSRDIRVREQLNLEGWDVLTVWECETKDQQALDLALTSYLQAQARPNASG